MDWETAQEAVRAYGYFILFPIMIIEGPLITAAAAAASVAGLFDIRIVFLLSFAGDVIGDIAFFAFGSLGMKRAVRHLERWFGITNERIRRIEGFLHRHAVKTLVVMKYTPILAGPGLAIAGLAGIKWKKFLIVSILATLPNTVFYTILGLLAGSSAWALTILPYGSMIVPLVAIIAVLLISLYKKITTTVVRTLEDEKL
jgi:membrane protein DedA with SNARE-associated domain